MSVTIGKLVRTVVQITGRGFSSPEAAVTAAAKAAGYTVRGSKYFDETGAPTGLTNRAEAVLIFLGYRWITEVDGRWFVTSRATTA